VNSPFNALMNPAEVGASISTAFKQGREDRRQSEVQNALAAYAQNQSPETAGEVTRHDPMLGIQLQDRETARAEQARKEEEAKQERMLIGAALNGDPQARAALAYANADWYMKLDGASKQQVDQVMGAIAQQAFSILQQPENQRGALLQQALQGLQAQGIDTSQFTLSGDPTQDLKSALAVAGKLDQWERFAQPSYQPIGEAGLAGFQFGQPIQQGGQVQNFGAPQQAAPQVPTMRGRELDFQTYQGAVAGLGEQDAAAWLARNGMTVRIANDAEWNALPSGAEYTAPDGSRRRKP
jgi:hypothetical protein